VTTGPGKSWKVLEFRKSIFQARKVMENSKGHVKAWKISIVSCILLNFYNCTEKFCNVILILILVCIHKSCVVYLEKYVVPVGDDFHFLVVEKSWKILFEKEW